MFRTFVLARAVLVTKSAEESRENKGRSEICMLRFIRS